jgi:hypothetical protein
MRRVQQPELSISTTGERLERGGALVIFPLPLFFNFQLVCAYVCVVFVRTQNWQVWFDRADLWDPPVRSVWSMSTKYNLDFTIA